MSGLPRFTYSCGQDADTDCERKSLSIDLSFRDATLNASADTGVGITSSPQIITIESVQTKLLFFNSSIVITALLAVLNNTDIGMIPS